MIPPNSSALLSNHVPLLSSTNTPGQLKPKMVIPIIMQAMNGFISSYVNVKPAAIASILVAIASINITLCVIFDMSSSIPSENDS